MDEEKPLVVVTPIRIIFFFLVIAIVFWTIGCVFGVLIPILTTGNFNAGWFADSRANTNIERILLALAWVPLSPFTVFVKNVGVFSFYDDRIEVMPFLGWKTRVFLYTEIHVMVNGPRGVTISRNNLPGWSQPWQRYKAEYLEAGVVFFSQRNIGDDNYTINAQKALDILQQKVSKIRKKYPDTPFQGGG